MSKVCPHCHGTGYSESRVQPMFQYAGRRFPKRQAQLLALLMDAEGREVQRQFLIDQMYEETPVSRVIDMHVTQLRRALAGTDVEIHSFQTGGYMLKRVHGVGRSNGRELKHDARYREAAE